MSEEKIRRRPYGPPHPDGFPDGEEDTVAYCPREKKKKTPAEHRACDHHLEGEVSPEEIREAAPCGYEETEEEGEGER
ncbi:MAG: hypothetical protein ABIH26_06825 [Candidatus Eisenbacteria bacterium]